ncbi:GGDEF domain-containing protein [Niallia nealsonii]|uniref:GGDEF domain-containing protein n=2 Tax=Niallia nealsonii TaxID=115979 RepID=A0A2N0YWR9_9BACI|nr:GGDEF domain-containing protein [Niallia nealsonii]
MKISIWAVWLILLPLGLWFLYQTYPPKIDGNTSDILAFLLFMSVVASMPMMINGRPVFFLQWASLSVFLIFGLFIETVLVQLALIPILLQLRLSQETRFRLPLNSSMFFLVSISSGLIYYGLGGKHAADILWYPNSLFLVILYPLIYFLLNAILIFFISQVVYQRKEKFFTLDLGWEFVTTLITYPVGIALYIMYKQIGLIALVLIGIPFISLSVILRLYHSSRTVNDYLKEIAELGHQLTQNLQVKETIAFFTNSLYKLFKLDFVFIHEVDESNALTMIARVENKRVFPSFPGVLLINEGICGNVFSTKEPAIYHQKREWLPINKGYMPMETESVLAIPLLKNEQVIGILIVGSKKKRAFVHVPLMVLQLLCSQFAVAFENAKYFEKTKEFSERCALTKLYNYCFFEQLLTSKFQELKSSQINQLVLIMLDIDYFKSINDTYGHQAGNEVLVEFAKRIKYLVGNKGIVARYGGEEFSILLTNINIQEASELAEFIRRMIEIHSFTIKQSMKSQPAKIKITASIGLASAPHDADEPLALIKHADRALYTGAKQAGRNRVARYVK